MSQPVVVFQSPAPAENSVVLGTVIEVKFDQAVDQATVNDSTFALIGPGTGIVLDASDLAVKGSRPTTTKEYLTGTFVWPAPDTLHFTPGVPLQPKTEYTITVSGGSTTLAKNVIKNLAGEKLKQAYTWKFTTTDLVGTVTPVVSPVLELNPDLPLEQIRVLPRLRIGTNLLEAIEIWFPDDLDPASLDPSYFTGNPDTNPFNDIIVSIDALNNDPQVEVPADITYLVTVEANRILVQLRQGT